MGILDEGCLECRYPADLATIGNGECNKCDGTGVEGFYGPKCRRCGGDGVCPRCGGEGQYSSLTGRPRSSADDDDEPGAEEETADGNEDTDQPSYVPTFSPLPGSEPARPPQSTPDQTTPGEIIVGGIVGGLKTLAGLAILGGLAVVATGILAQASSQLKDSEEKRKKKASKGSKGRKEEEHLRRKLDTMLNPKGPSEL